MEQLKNIKKGDRINCPFCHEETIVKQEIEMDGWTKKGEILLCALCGKKLADAADDDPKEQKTGANLSALQALLGGETLQKVEISLDQKDRRFCKDCKFSVRNAFIIRCGLSGKTVESMDDCDKFQRRGSQAEQ
jgi:hypothetical protein